MSLSDKYNQIQTHMNTLSTHLADLEVKSKKASAPKARASSQLAKNLLMELRKDIMVHVKGIETKPRKKAEIISPTHSAVQAEEEVKEEATTGPLIPKRAPGQQKDNSEPEINPSPVVAPSPVISPKKKVIKKPRVVKPKTK